MYLKTQTGNTWVTNNLATRTLLATLFSDVCCESTAKFWCKCPCRVKIVKLATTTIHYVLHPSIAEHQSGEQSSITFVWGETFLSRKLKFCWCNLLVFCSVLCKISTTPSTTPSRDQSIIKCTKEGIEFDGWIGTMQVMIQVTPTCIQVQTCLSWILRPNKLQQNVNWYIF